MVGTAVEWQLIARDQASKAFLGAAASAKEMQAAVTKSFTEQEAVARRTSSRMMASLKAEEAALARAAAEAEKYGKATALINSHKEQLDKVAVGLAGIGAAAAVGFGAAVKQSMDFNDEMARVGAFSDDARAHMDQLRQLSMKVGVSMGFSATQSADAMEELVKAGVSAKDMINGGLKGALQLAAAGQIDVSQATSIAAAAMTQFGLAGNKIPHVADLLAAGADKALGGVGDLGEAMTYAGTQAHQYGISIEDTVGVLADFAQSGQLGSQAGTTFSQVLARLGAPTGKAAAEMSKLGLNVYDANGNFVDMTTLAGRLQKAFEHLSPAQRNAAEQTIFGQRAIRGANILIQSGAKGVQNWINKVNDQGFAAQTAGKKMDSLKGDLQKLRAEFDNLLISSGNSSQGPIRGAVQQLTKWIDEWNNLSTGAKTAIADVVGAIGVLGLGGAGTIKALQGAAAIKKAYTDLGLGKAAGAMKGFVTSAAGLSAVGVAAGPAAAALGLGAIALYKWEQKQADIKQSAQGFDAVLDGMTGKINDNTAALNKNIRQQAIKQLNDAGAYRSANQLGISYNDVTRAALGNAAAQKRVNAATADAIGKQTQGSLSAAGYASANKDSSAAVTGNADAARKLNDALGTTRTGLSKSIQAHNDYAKATKAAADATNTGTSATKQAGNAQTTWSGTVKAATQAVKQEQKELKAQRDALLASANAALQASGDQIAYKQAVADASKAVKDNKHTLDLNTQAGRDNKSALDNLAGSSLKYIQDLINSKASTDKLRSATQDARGEFIKTAEQMGATKAQAKKLADQYDLVPKNVITKVTTPGATQALRNLQKIEAQIKDAQGKTVTVKYNVITGDATSSYSGGAAVAHAKAGGGPITGPGTGTSDQVPIMASNGEYMQTAAAHAYYGTAGMDAIRSMRVPKELLAGFAAGGPIGLTVNNVMSAGAAGAVAAAMRAAQERAIAAAVRDAKNAVPKIPAAAGGGSVTRWAPLILQALAQLGQSASLLGAVEHRMNQESGGNPRAINLWDANAAAGHPSQGLMQTIPGTFNDYAGPYRSRGILDPMANIYAGLNYALHAYPSLQYAMMKPGGYASGTNWATPGIHDVAENGAEIIWGRSRRKFLGGEQVSNANETKKVLGGRSVTIENLNVTSKDDPDEIAQKIATRTGDVMRMYGMTMGALA